MKKVMYYYDDDVGNYHYGNGHPMKPHRMRMAHSLLKTYNVLDQLDIVSYDPNSNVEEHFSRFHTEDYIDFLRTVNPENQPLLSDLFVGFNMGEDCPVFDGLYDFCKIYSHGSLMAATYLNEQKTQIAINWSGGLHHAKQQEASGFCYINDCVLAILELLRCHHRVLYLDIDIHHGDGVEEAFYITDRVMTCSFHKYGNYFPDTGHFTDCGYGKGDGYSVNFPLQEGMDDESFQSVFKPLVQTIMDTFQPNAILMQCGSDSLSGDRLGCFNLSVQGHGECVSFIKSFGLPTVVTGGGGYTLRNVARCWAHETAILAGIELDSHIPESDEYRGYYAPNYSLYPPISNMENQNSKEYLNKSLETIVNQIKEKVMPFGPLIDNYKDVALYNTVNERYLPKKSQLNKMAQFAHQFYGNRRFQLIDKYFEQARETEKNRFKEIFAAVRVQALFRMFKQKKRYSKMQWAVKIIKKVYKGYHIRKRFWALIDQELSHQRFTFYSSAATAIQRMYRGYYSRKYAHDFYARKKYIKYIEEKNEKRLQKLRNHQEQQIVEDQKRQEEQARAEFYKLANSLHHLTSTVTIPGVYKKLEEVSDFGKHSLKA